MDFDKPIFPDFIKEILELREEVAMLKSQLPDKDEEDTTPQKESRVNLPTKEEFDDLLHSNSENEISKFLQNINQQVLVVGFVSIHKLDGRHLFLSENFDKLTGYKRHMLIGKGAYTFMHEVDIKKVKNILHAQNLKGKNTVTNWRMRHAKGYHIWLETHSHIIFDKDNKPAYIYCLNRDISDKMFTQNKLEQSRKLYNSIYHSSPDALFLLDVNTLEIYDCNKRALKLFKYSSKSEIFGKHFSELQIKKFSFPDIYRINKLINSKKIWTAEVNCLDSNGHIFEGIMAMRKGDNPDAPLILMRVSDLTNLKNSQSVIQQQEQLIASISENVNEGIYRSTLNGKMIYANKAFARIFGYSSVDEVLKIRVEDLYASAEQREDIVDKIHKLGILNNEEVLFINKKGYNFWGLLNCKLSKGKNGEFYFDGAIKDITENKNYQSQLELQNQELTEVNNALDRFVYSASHDLRAPIASSLGLIDIAMREKDADIIKEYLQLQAKTLRKLDNFISDIIDFSRNSRLEVKHDEIDFDSMLKNAFETYEYMENAARISKEVSITQESSFFTDKNRLNIIINNFLSNAIKYANPYQEQPKIKVSIEIDKKNALISIQDNGLGIPEEHVDKIFEMFHRAHPDKKGSGLGLFIVKEAIQKMKGHVEVSSREGKGTTFIINLPNMIELKKEAEVEN